MTALHRYSWPYGCTLALLLLLCGLGGSTNGQVAAQDGSVAAAADQPEPEQPADPLEASRKQYLELAISIAADFASPVQDQAALVIAQQELVDSRFDAPVRAALAADKDSGQPLDDRRIAAAVALLRHTTIEPKDQVSLLLDLLVARSLNERSHDGRLFRQGMLRMDVPGIATAVVSRLTFLPESLAEELQTRLSEDQPPVVLYAAAGLTAEYGAALVPKLLAVAAESDDRFVKAAVFQAVGRIVESESQNRLQAQRAAAARAAGRVPSEELNALAEKANVSPKSLEYAMRIIQRNDSDGDGVLAEKEWSGLLVNPAPADTNKDGRVTAEEYAAWMESRSSR